MCRLLEPCKLTAGAVVYRRGEIGDRMYFLHSGRIAVEGHRLPVAAAATTGDEEQTGIKHMGDVCVLR